SRGAEGEQGDGDEKAARGRHRGLLPRSIAETTFASAISSSKKNGVRGRAGPYDAARYEVAWLRLPRPLSYVLPGEPMAPGDDPHAGAERRSRRARTRLAAAGGIVASAVLIGLYARIEWPWTVLGWVALVPWLVVLDRARSAREAAVAGAVMAIG